MVDFASLIGRVEGGTEGNVVAACAMGGCVEHWEGREGGRARRKS
jgi:hypothetical protein